MYLKPGSVLIVLSVLFLSSTLHAEPYPHCPMGCVPDRMVESYMPGVDPVENPCPGGCTPLAGVKSFLDAPQCEPPQATSGTAQAIAAPAPVDCPIAVPCPIAEPCPEQKVCADPEPCPAKKKRKSILAADFDEAEEAEDIQETEEVLRTVDYTDHFITVGQTAFGLKKKELVITGHMLGEWDIQYGVTDKIHIGVQTVIPAMIYGFVPTFRFHTDINENFSIGGGLIAGIGGMFGVGDAMVFPIGGSVELSYRKNNHILNLSFMTGSFGYNFDSDSGFADGAVLIPDIGYRYAFNPNWSFQAEVLFPIWVDDDGEPMDLDSFTVPILYGFRVHGEMLFGEFGFMFPASKWFKEHMWKYAPLGFPYISLGFHL